VGAQVRSPSEAGVCVLLHRNAPLWKAVKGLYFAGRRLVMATTWRSKRNALAELARSAGFATSIVFRYCYPGETWPVNLGLCAGSSVSEAVVRQSLERFREYVDVSTVDVTAIRSQV
jgi:hypothetical protein